MTEQLTVLKIGGSVITEKKKGVKAVLREDSLTDICKAISKSYSPGSLILVHGAGSFGHPYVEEYGVNNPEGVARTHLACLELNKVFCEKLVDFGVASVPIHPLNFFRRSGELECNLDLITRSLSFGLLPVLHGDVILNTVSGEFEVLSGDEVVTFLCEKLPVSRVGFATDVEGIFVEGKIARKFDRSLLEKIERNGGENLKSDVTGEMTGKLSKIFKMKASCRVYIFKGDYENVAKFLRGEGVGTEIIR